MIELSDVQLRYSEDTQFHFDLHIEAGQSVGVIGSSGAGKSTLLQLLAGFLEPQSGRIHLDGVDHTLSLPALRPISMVFQANNLFDHLDVATNIGLGLNPSFSKKRHGLEKVLSALEQVGLAGYQDRKPTQLSGGEAQRVALARVLVRDKPILLLDEPFAALGPSMRADFSDLISRLQKERGLTLVTVSHAPTELVGLCDQLAFVEKGRIVTSGRTQAVLDKPNHPGLAAYLGQT